MKNISLFILLVGVLGACQPAESDKEVAGDTAASVALYEELHRPQFHFTPPAQWMNDPNGMFFYEGEYHLFYQHYPDSNVWGPMHWGHAISTDLVHWEHLPIALYPDTLGLIFSGSAVVDWENTSGFGQQGQPPIVAIFTHHDMEGEKAGRNDFQYQSIAYSTDKGRTWTKYAGNPVIPNAMAIRDFRDPKVVWDPASQQWVMVFAAKDHVQFWVSPNLKDWTHTGDFGQAWGAHGGVWECPDLFQMVVEGTGERKWVLLQSLNPGGPNGGSGTQYFVGDFDGKAFRMDADFAKEVANGRAIWLDYGRDNYAGVTWSDIPASDGRRLFMGWMSNWDYAQVVPTTIWRSAMTLPRELVLVPFAEGYRLLSKPVKELRGLRTQTHDLGTVKIGDTLHITARTGIAADKMELELVFECGADADFGVELMNKQGERYRIGYNSGSQQYYSDRTRSGDIAFSDKFAVDFHTAPRQATDHFVRMRLYFDVASVEMFADNEATVLTDIFFPSTHFTVAQLYKNKGEVKLMRGIVHGLKSVWKED